MAHRYYDSSSAPKILLVDNIETNLTVLGIMLEEWGYEISVATNGEQMLSCAVSNPPDLILLAVQMPEMDGYEACNALKQTELTAHIPVIFLTPVSDVEEIIKGFDAGGVDFVPKPFNRRELLARIHTHLELKFAREKIEHLSWYDELTNIPNKRFFNRSFAIEWKRALRKKVSISLLMVDIDHFKKFNDTHGHIEGDRCLQTIAKTIESCIERPADFTARFGGEEFICVLPDTDEAGALHIAEKILQQVAQLKISVVVDGEQFDNNVSIGASTTIPAKETDMMQFISKSDKALYQAKQNGRNQVVAFSRD
ncbi:MAG: diguanylate cyclase [Desulfobacteraceae bacterium]|nr:diguanylate cyclase [Desulfobacteraceae bacterium]